jgi:hypothetical protein
MGFQNYAFEIGSDAMICIPNFINIGSDIQQLIRGYRDAKTEGDLLSIFFFSK